jgi:hypothetical protein
MAVNGIRPSSIAASEGLSTGTAVFSEACDDRAAKTILRFDLTWADYAAASMRMHAEHHRISYGSRRSGLGIRQSGPWHS